MTPFDVLRETDRYKELEAIPVNSEVTEDTFSFSLVKRVAAIDLDIDNKRYKLTCTMYKDGTRSEFLENTLYSAL